MEFKIDKPYPEIKVEKENLEYAKLLLDDYVGIASEETSIQQYIYQSIDKFDVCPEFSNTLRGIAIVEMRHLDMLGKTIKALGVTPKFKFVNKTNKCMEYWNSSFVDYTATIEKMLKSDIELEKKAIISYKKHMSIIEDKYIKEILMRIIEDEVLHIECFNKLLYIIKKNSMV